MHVTQSDVARMLINLFLLYAAARVAGALCERVRLPAVVGELLAGVAIGPHALRLLPQSPVLSTFNALFANLGIIFLLFIVGLETQPARLWQVGREATRVCLAGLACSFGLGYLVMQVWHASVFASLFVATALAATSVGITARVLADMRALGRVVANVIVGAAVLDDILGIVVLTLVVGVVRGTAVGWDLALLVIQAAAFALVTVLLGRQAVHRITPRMARAGSGREPVFALAVTLCFGFSALAEIIGLAGIIGAFFAGIIFAETREAEQLRRTMRPIYELFVPIFFVLMGAQVDLHGLAAASLVGLGLLIALAAIAGKVVGCGLGALSLGKRQALAVGVGMVPRGEVALVAASVGLNRGVVSTEIYSVIILVCVVTSLLAPPLLRPLLAEEAAEEGPGGEGRP